MNSTTTPNLAHKLKAAFLADPKKTVALSVLTAVFLVMGWRTFISKGEPSRVGAAASRLLGAGSAKPNANETATTPVTRGSPYAALIQKWSEGPVPPVSRNLFAVRMDYFPADGSRTSQSGGGNEGFWGRLEKSITMKADLRDKRENLIANFKAQASQLRLQSTMMGPEPKALVNGELVGEGSVVANFRVLKIEARRLIVEREGIRLEILMK